MNLDPHLHNFLGGIAVSLDPIERFRVAMGEPRTFQLDLLTSNSQRVIAAASRQLGKSTSIACIAWDAFLRGLTVVVIAPTDKQAKEFLLRVKAFRDADPFAPQGIQFLKTEVNALNHRGRILAMPATESARGFTADVLILDEAAYIGDDEIAAILPLRNKLTGRLIAISTPNLREGWFYERWAYPNGYHKVFGHYRDVPELAAIIERERGDMSAHRFAREYDCQFVGSGEPLVSHAVLDRAMQNKECALVL
jgi:hypothetical protein